MVYLKDEIINRTEKSSGPFDDERILRGEVSLQEQIDLERRLLTMYRERAEKLGKPVITTSNKAKYEELRKSGKLFDGNAFYLLMDENNTQILDMRPVLYHLLDTKEGMFYTKLTTHGKYLQP